MKTFIKVAACLLIFCLVEGSFTQSANAKFLQQAEQKDAKSANKKEKKIDNKIAASDDTPTADKGTKKQASKKSRISNK